MTICATRNVSMGHGCPRLCQIRINRALSLTKGHNSNNNWWILSVIELDLYLMVIYLCMKYESNSLMYSKDITRKPFFIRRKKTISLIIIKRILSFIELDLYFMIIYLCVKYESNSLLFSKDIARKPIWKPIFIRRSRAITLIIIGGFYP